VTLETTPDQLPTLELFDTLEEVLFDSLEVFLSEVEDVTIKRTIERFGTYFITRLHTVNTDHKINYIFSSKDCKPLIHTVLSEKNIVRFDCQIGKIEDQKLVSIIFLPVSSREFNEMN
jgi:hypothetical protein